MSSLCHNIKTEYDALRALKEKFVFACDDAKVSVGSFDALSKQELRKLKLLKRELEHKRDKLNEKIETKEFQLLKKLYKTVLEATVTEDGSFNDMSVKDLIQRDEFQKNVVEGITNYARSNGASSRFAVTGFHAALGVGLLDVHDRGLIHDFVEREKYQKTFGHWVEEFAMSDGSQWNVLTCFQAALALEVFSEEQIKSIRTQIEKPKFNGLISKDIWQSFEVGNYHLGVIGLYATLELGFDLNPDVRMKIMALICEDKFINEMAEQTIAEALEGQTSMDGSLYCIRTLNAIRGLMELSRHRRILTASHLK